MWAIAFALGCGDAPGTGQDAAAGAVDAARPVDAGGVADRIDPLLWVDFSVAGCAAGGIDAEPCVGVAPLTVRFLAAAPAPIDVYVWSFGDGSPAESSAAPAHTFERPGAYDVALTVGGPGGTASQRKAGWVVVAPAPLGAACRVDAQCAGGLACACGDGAGCPPGLADGWCSAECGGGTPCPPGGVCADLGDGSAPWQGARCLAACASAGDCRPGWTCRSVRSDGGWATACLPAGVIADVGESCAAADGSLDASACVGGVCAAAGARGLCAADCAGGCPPYAACATFAGDLGALCVARCGPDRPCDADPWLACEAPGGAGPSGFTVDEAPAAGGYCAPRPCAEPGDCGEGGACVGGRCVRSM